VLATTFIIWFKFGIFGAGVATSISNGIILLINYKITKDDVSLA
jgi:Na+-driven multidrug efflux pump